MSTPMRKPLANATNANLGHRSQFVESSPSRSSTTSPAPTSTVQGLARSDSMQRSGLTRKPTQRLGSTTTGTDVEDDERKAANAQLILDLKESVQRAEQASEQYRKQLEFMQKRLDETANEQTAAEEREFQRRTELDLLRAELKDNNRQRREVELSQESERRLFLQQQERQANKEAELQGAITRLNETLRVKGLERSNTMRAVSMPNAASEDNINLSTGSEEVHQRHMQQIHERDHVIEALRLELIEAQLKFTEHEHSGDGRLQALEHENVDIKMRNARLQEENESFQMLLGEKTLKGDLFAEHRSAEDSMAMSSLADELASVEYDVDGHSEAFRKLETDLKTMREQNKALTLYVDKIIGRILQHEGFEHIITGKDEPPALPAKHPIATVSNEKALPATPEVPENGQSQPQSQSQPPQQSTAVGGFLQRARSVVARTGPSRMRPQSMIGPAAPATTVVPSANENPQTAPSIPLTRGHRRARSDQAQADMGSAAVVQHMTRGSPLRTVSGGPTSPGLGTGSLSPRSSSQSRNYFGSTIASSNGTLTAEAKPAPGHGRGSSQNSITSSVSADKDLDSTDASSLQAGSHGKNEAAIPGAVMKQNALRPLRLVQERDEIDQKKANRGSGTWMGWFKGSAAEANLAYTE